MSKAKIKDKVKLELAITSGGCCERCHIFMYEDFLTKTAVKFSEHAHIIPDSDNIIAPRAEEKYDIYDKESSDNIMLLCSNCHTIIDKNPEQFTVKILRDMKKMHNERTRYLLSLQEDKEVNTIIYVARIKDKDISFNKQSIDTSILNDGFYPKNHSIFNLSATIEINDEEKNYYEIQVQHLNNLFEKYKIEIAKRKSFLFALAPQPLLIKLGTLLNKSYDINIKQKTREPEGWFWLEKNPLIFILTKPKEICKTNDVCIVFSISDTIDKSRINELYPKDKDIWEVTIKKPNMNCVLTKSDVSNFSGLISSLFNELLQTYGKDKIINIFPAMPNSLAIELGRNYMPKIHNDLNIYDHIKTENENNFIKAISFIRGKDTYC